MKEMSKFILLGILTAILFGCSSKTDNQSSSDTATANDTIDRLTAKYYIPPAELTTTQDSIEVMLNDAMARLRYKDNSGLYENEFSYLTDQTSFDEYLTYTQVSTEQPALVNKILIDSLTMYGTDSALVFCMVDLHFTKTNKDQILHQELMVYNFRDHWIKPTVSVMAQQAGYDELIRKAEEATKWEEE